MFQVDQVKEVVGISGDEVTLIGILIGIIMLLLIAVRSLVNRSDKVDRIHREEREAWNAEKKEYAQKLEAIIEKYSSALTRFIDINKRRD